MSLVDDARFAMPASESAADVTTTTAPEVDAELIAAVDAVEDTTAEAVADDAAEADDTTDSTDAAEGDDKAAEAEPTLTFGDLGLPDDIVRALAKRDVTTPFPIQAATIPDALAYKDVLGRGRTGSGKTLSFGLPLLTRLAAA